jgi:hypothetical protein
VAGLVGAVQRTVEEPSGAPWARRPPFEMTVSGSHKSMVAGRGGDATAVAARGWSARHPAQRDSDQGCSCAEHPTRRPSTRCRRTAPTSVPAFSHRTDGHSGSGPPRTRVAIPEAEPHRTQHGGPEAGPTRCCSGGCACHAAGRCWVVCSALVSGGQDQGWFTNTGARRRPAARK